MPFEVSLYRWPGLDGRLFIGEFSPEKLEELRRQRVRLALDAKCPKLLAAKGESRISVLVLESDDIALANPVVIGNALVQGLSSGRETFLTRYIWSERSLDNNGLYGF